MTPEEERREGIAGWLISLANHVRNGLNITDIKIDYEKGIMDFKAIFPAFPEEVTIDFNRTEAERFKKFMKEIKDQENDRA